jgi:peptidoglycan-associated lipoprotein
MTKMSKIFTASLILVLLVLIPACRTTKKNVKTDTPPPAMDTTPTVPPPPPPDDSVKPSDDFVKDDTVTPEVVPTDERELNNWAREKGYIRDAFYNYDEATLDESAQQALSASATWLRGQGSSYKLLIEGHCDERGTEQYNLALGDRRANSAKEYLATLGIDASRIRTVSYGEERPFEEGHDDNSFAQNRRAHLVLVR